MGAFDWPPTARYVIHTCLFLLPCCFFHVVDSIFGVTVFFKKIVVFRPRVVFSYDLSIVMQGCRHDEADVDGTHEGGSEGHGGGHHAHRQVRDIVCCDHSDNTDRLNIPTILTISAIPIIPTVRTIPTVQTIPTVPIR